MVMRNLCRALTLLVAAGLTITVAFSQSDEQGAGADSSYSPPRTPWGDPDIQGAWDYRSITPLERPRQYGDRAFYTDEEIAQLEGQAARRMDAPPDENTPTNLVHAQYMTDPGRFVDESRRTSLIIDPPNGRIPETVAGRQGGGRGMGGGRQVDFDKPWESRALLERCISRGLPGALLPGLYNNNILITQSPGFVAIAHEMVHETRVIPLDGRKRIGLRGYMGESRGHWEGDTLVVETTNFNEAGGYRGASENLTMIERYTLVSPELIDFRLTFDDDTTWAQPWTAAYSMRPTEGGFYEYACHEGNYGLRNILENMMIEERARIEAAASGN
jgi:hypothetical protein